ncbi:exonuclease domain-containing protein [Corynebacterium dentalis]|uniref:exonuclease domain-containing protein n=1 Tax=Corynebacterium dentalis TaxID=2014528 RepID=UPI00289A836F|nr:exonuclease domain-containing protein [Corynebacterium dentalis]
MLNFTAIDVETANSDRGSVCAVGLALVRDSQLVRTVEWHVRPPTGVDQFDARNVGIHGITPDMVRTAATWGESLEEISSLSEQHPLVAFNAAFDKSVVTKASALVGMEPLANPFHCALKLSRRLMTLDQYKLPLVASELGLAPFSHHNAGSDAGTCAKVVLALSEIHDLRTVDSLWVPASSSARSKTQPGPTAFSKANRAALADLPQPNPNADPNHPFFGRQVIITGDLESYSRWDAAEAIAHVGGVNGKGVTKKTAFLVVGDGRTHDRIALESGTTKERKAAAYIDAGQKIQVLTESEFIALAAAPIVQELRVSTTDFQSSEVTAEEPMSEKTGAENDGTWLHERELQAPLAEVSVPHLLPNSSPVPAALGDSPTTAVIADSPVETQVPKTEQLKRRVSYTPNENLRPRSKPKVSSSFVGWLLLFGVVAVVSYLLAR